MDKKLPNRNSRNKVKGPKGKKGFEETESQSNLVSEIAVAYKRRNRDENVRLHEAMRAVKFNNGAPILVGIVGRPENQLTSFEKMQISSEGISKKDLENLKDKSALNYDQLATLLSVTKATLINKKGRSKFKSNLSEKIVELADIYSYGFSVFEDEEKFNEWIFRPNKALGERAPFDILHNSFGREEVKNLIGRIEYGVYS